MPISEGLADEHRLAYETAVRSWNGAIRETLEETGMALQGLSDDMRAQILGASPGDLAGVPAPIGTYQVDPFPVAKIRAPTNLAKPISASSISQGSTTATSGRSSRGSPKEDDVRTPPVSAGGYHYGQLRFRQRLSKDMIAGFDRDLTPDPHRASLQMLSDVREDKIARPAPRSRLHSGSGPPSRSSSAP